MTKTPQTKRSVPSTRKAKAPPAEVTTSPATTSQATASPEALAPDTASPVTQAPSPRRPSGKLGAMIDLLSRPEGADIADMMHATGWQAHSVRGAMSGALKKKLGLNITSQKTEAGRIYHIVQENAR